jgi:hypothetical protein
LRKLASHKASSDIPLEHETFSKQVRVCIVTTVIHNFVLSHYSPDGSTSVDLLELADAAAKQSSMLPPTGPPWHKDRARSPASGGQAQRSRTRCNQPRGDNRTQARRPDGCPSASRRDCGDGLRGNHHGHQSKKKKHSNTLAATGRYRRPGGRQWTPPPETDRGPITPLIERVSWEKCVCAKGMATPHSTHPSNMASRRSEIL